MCIHTCIYVYKHLNNCIHRYTHKADTHTPRDLVKRPHNNKRKENKTKKKEADCSQTARAAAVKIVQAQDVILDIHSKLNPESCIRIFLIYARVRLKFVSHDCARTKIEIFQAELLTVQVCCFTASLTLSIPPFLFLGCCLLKTSFLALFVIIF